MKMMDFILFNSGMKKKIISKNSVISVLIITVFVYFYLSLVIEIDYNISSIPIIHPIILLRHLCVYIDCTVWRLNQIINLNEIMY